MSAPSPGLSFDWMIAPVKPEQFFAKHFERELLLLKRDSPDYYTGLLTLDEIDHVITGIAPKSSDVGLVNADDEVKISDYTYSDGRIDPSRVYQKFHEGSTIILQQLHTKLQKLGEFCRSLESVFSARTQTNVYLTPGEKQGFKPHYDNHDVFVLQVLGSKTWRIYENMPELPLRGQPFVPDEFDPGAVTRSFSLEPGDMLYIPRGHPHAAVSDSGLSLHITTGLLVDTWTDLILDAVSALALAEPAFRHSLPPGFARADSDRSDSREQFRRLLSLLSERADPDAAFDRFASEFVSKRHPLLPGQMGQIIRLGTLGLDSMVGARSTLIYWLDHPPTSDGDEETGDAEIVIQCYGRQVRLPAYTHEAVAYSLSNARFRVRDVPGDLDDDGKLVLIRRLIREGMIMMRD